MKDWIKSIIFVALVKMSFNKSLPNGFSKVLDSMLVKYDIRLRPNFIGQPLSVGIQLSIISIDSISEVNMDYTMTMHLHQFWTDERLAFKSLNLNSTKSVDLINLSEFARRIWLPDIFFNNHKTSFIHEVTQKNEMIRLHGNGSILYSLRFTATFSCMMDLHHYPMDTQTCEVDFSSYGYTMNDLLLYWKEEPVVGLNNIILPQFIIKKYNTKDRKDTLSTGNYQHLTLFIGFQRNIGYFIFQMYLPSILIVMLSWVSFWINHEATSARVTLGITTVLTITTINTGMRSVLPRISYVKAIDIYLVVCFIFVFAALVEFAAVNYKHWAVKTPKYSRKFSEKCSTKDQFSKEETQNQLSEESPRVKTQIKRRRHTNNLTVVGLLQNLIWTPKKDKNPRLNKKPNNIDDESSNSPNSEINVQDKNRIDRISRFVFPITFIMFNVFYWGFYILYHKSI